MPSNFVILGIVLDGPSTIFSDSGSAIKMSWDPVAFKNTKHILRAANFLRDLVAREAVQVSHVPGKTMLADLLTKAVARVTFLELLRIFDDYARSGVACPATV